MIIRDTHLKFEARLFSVLFRESLAITKQTSRHVVCSNLFLHNGSQKESLWSFLDLIKKHHQVGFVTFSSSWSWHASHDLHDQRIQRISCVFMSSFTDLLQCLLFHRSSQYQSLENWNILQIVCLNYYFVSDVYIPNDQIPFKILRRILYVSWSINAFLDIIRFSLGRSILKILLLSSIIFI